jgi:hypothetical protein
MWSLLISLSLIQGATPPLPASRLTLELQEGTKTSRYRLDLAPGKIRVDPEGEKVHLILETTEPSLSVVFREERFYCKLTPPAVRRMVAAGLLRPSWLPWVYRVSPDLVEDISLERSGKTALVVHSKKYGRQVARYEWQPSAEPDPFFQWRESYLSFWGEDDETMDQAQRKRLELYAEVGGPPLLIEERFAFLSRPRTLRVLAREPAPADAFLFRPPADFPEKSEAALRWEAASRRFIDWLMPRERREPKRP